MYELTYKSTAQPNCTQDDILDILHVSRRKNKECDVTGCLIYHKDSFIQILEGTKKDVKKIYKSITKDTRHYAIKLLWEGSLEARAFSDWNMAFYSLEGAKKANEVKQFEDNLLLLGSFSKMQSAAVILFWKNVEKLILGQKSSKFRNNV